MVAIGRAPVISGRIKILPLVGDRISLALTELLTGEFYELQRSEYLNDLQWVSVRNFNTVSAEATLADVFDATSSTVFYRLRQGPKT